MTPSYFFSEREFTKWHLNEASCSQFQVHFNFKVKTRLRNRSLSIFEKEHVYYFS
jgi:hypothetical protein